MRGMEEARPNVPARRCNGSLSPPERWLRQIHSDDQAVGIKDVVAYWIEVSNNRAVRIDDHERRLAALEAAPLPGKIEARLTLLEARARRAVALAGELLE